MGRGTSKASGKSGGGTDLRAGLIKSYQSSRKDYENFLDKLDVGSSITFEVKGDQSINRERFMKMPSGSWWVSGMNGKNIVKEYEVTNTNMSTRTQKKRYSLESFSL